MTEILSAYAAASLGWLSNHRVWYFLFNLSGAATIAYEARSKKDTQPFVLNITWATVASIGLRQTPSS